MLRRLVRGWKPYVSWRRIHAYGYWRTYSEWRFARGILSRAPVDFSPNPDLNHISVHTLCCQRDYLFCIWALRSLFRFLPGFSHVTIHMDRGVRAQAAEHLTAQFPLAHIVPWAHGSAAIGADPELSRCRHLLAHREHNSTLVKLVDVPLFARSSRILFVDPDVFFFKDPSELFSACISQTKDSIFQLDPISNYSVSPEHAAKTLGTTLPERLNSGFTLLNREVYSAVVLEELLADPLLNTPHTVMEQTLIVLAASRRGPCRTWPASYLISMQEPSKKDVPTVRHYAGPSKRWIVSDALARLQGQGL